MATRTISDAGGNWNATTAWVEGVVPENGADVVATATSGNLVINVSTNALKSFDLTNYVGTLSGASTLFVYGVTGATNVCLFSAGMTQNWTGHLRLSPPGTGVVNLTTNGKLLQSLSMQGSLTTSSVVLQDNLSFTARQTGYITLTSPFNLNGKTVSGNSAINRLLVSSVTVGSQSTITVNGGTFANCDFMDILFANGGSNLDLSAITGGSGDCGGNGMSGGGTLTFTTAVEQTWSGATGNWSNSALWTSRIPLPQDNVVIPDPGAASRTLTVDMPRMGANITVTNAVAANKPTWNFNGISATSLYGSMTLVSSTYLAYNISARPLNFYGRGNHTLTTAGQIVYTTNMYGFGGKLTLQDALNCGVGGGIGLANGEIDDGGYSVAIRNLASRFGSTARALTMAGVWTFNYYDSTIDVINGGAGLTLTIAPTAKIVFSGGSGTKSFWGGSKIWPDIDFTGAGTLTFNRYDTDTIGVLTVAGGNTIQLEPAKTLTIGGLVFTGADTDNRVTINSRTAGSAATMAKSTGDVSVDWATIQDSTVTGGNWYAGANSTDVSGNTGWTFTAPPSDSSFGWLKVTTRYQLVSSPFGGMRR